MRVYMYIYIYEAIKRVHPVCVFIWIHIYICVYIYVGIYRVNPSQQQQRIK